MIYTGERSCRSTETYWGCFGETGRKFLCAKTADKVSDFDLFRLFQLTEVVEHPTEIVRVIKSAVGSMVCATIADS